MAPFKGLCVIDSNLVKLPNVNTREPIISNPFSLIQDPFGTSLFDNKEFIDIHLQNGITDRSRSRTYITTTTFVHFHPGSAVKGIMEYSP